MPRKAAPGSTRSKRALPPPPATIDCNQGYPPNEAAALLRLGRSTIYNMVADGQLKAVRIRNRMRIPGSELIKLVEI